MHVYIYIYVCILIILKGGGCEKITCSFIYPYIYLNSIYVRVVSVRVWIRIIKKIHITCYICCQMYAVYIIYLNKKGV